MPVSQKILILSTLKPQNPHSFHIKASKILILSTLKPQNPHSFHIKASKILIPSTFSIKPMGRRLMT